jgi:hypothetical protein
MSALNEIDRHPNGIGTNIDYPVQHRHSPQTQRFKPLPVIGITTL